MTFSELNTVCNGSVCLWELSVMRIGAAFFIPLRISFSKIGREPGTEMRTGIFGEVE
jgi:hypothetical protein